MKLFYSLLFLIKSRVFLKYFLYGCLWKRLFTSKSLKTPSNLILLTNLIIMRLLIPFHLKIRPTELQKSTKFFLLHTSFFSVLVSKHLQVWKKKLFRYNVLVILILYQFFLSPQVKRSFIINNKHVTYELTQGFPNNLRFTICRN